MFDFEETIPFGKHRGTPLSQVDHGYLEWVLKQADNPDFYHRRWVKECADEIRAVLVALPEDIDSHGFQLNPGQQQAVEEICETFFERDDSVHRLQGGAGYGKSFAVAPVVVEAKRNLFQVRACATSYVATQNLAADLEPLNVSCKTIAAMLRLDVTYDGPKEIYQPGADTYTVLPEILAPNNMLVVDEYSMVDDVVGNLLLESVTEYGGKLLVVGDAYQLPSPAQRYDSVLCSVEPSSELVQPMRYAEDSDLYQVEKLVRSNPYAFDPGAFAGSKEVFKVRDLDSLVAQYVRLHNERPDESTIMLWYKRKDMVASNKMIRAAIYGSDAGDICEGEQLRIQRTANYTHLALGGDGIRVYSGTYVTAREAAEDVISLPMNDYGWDRTFVIPCTRINTDAGDMNVLFSVTEGKASVDMRGGAEFNNALNEIAEWCSANNSWSAYRDFRNTFVQVAYSYASTVHRVQGQSLDNVLTSPYALRQADPYQAAKLQYVGLTRAKKRLVCL